jgi:hypothetical protein
MKTAKRISLGLALLSMCLVSAYFVQQARYGQRLAGIRSVIASSPEKYSRVRCHLYYGDTIKVTGVVATETDLLILKQRLADTGIPLNMLVHSEERALPMLNGR